jgi:hypothetical protein
MAFLAMALAVGFPMQAQFGGFGNLTGGGGGGDTDKVIKSGTVIIAFSTIATDLAVASAQQMLGAFPPEAVAAIQEKFSKYNELKAARGTDGQMDADSATLASDGFSEMEKLDPGTYNKEKAKVVGPAYTKLGLALAADLVAIAQIPTFVSSGVKTISSIGSNPMILLKVGKLKTMVGTVVVLAKAIPSQINSIKTVRSIAKKIGEAENVTIGEPKQTIKTMDAQLLADSVKTEEAEG